MQDTFQKRLQIAMSKKGIRPFNLVKLTGIDKSRISCYLSGKYKPAGDAIVSLSTALGVSEAWLMGYDVPEQSSELGKAENKEILQAISDLRSDINNRFDGIDTRLNELESKQRRTAKKQCKQQADIDCLIRKVKELSQSDSVVWRSRNRREAAIDRTAAYSSFNDLGFSEREALRLIDEAEMLVRDKSSNGRTKTVRLPNSQGFIKAVVIFTDTSKEDKP